MSDTPIPSTPVYPNKKGGYIGDLDVYDIVSYFHQLQAYRKPYEWIWDEIAVLCLPNRGGRFARRHSPAYIEELYDATGAQSLEFLQSTILGGLANPQFNWFRVALSKSMFNDAPYPLKPEVERRTEKMYELLLSPKSRFYTQLGEAMTELIAYGTACLEVVYAPARGILFKSHGLADLWISTNNIGEVDTVYQLKKMTAKQMVQQWGEDAISKEALETYYTEPMKLFEVLRCVMPNEDYNAGKTDTLKYINIYIELGGDVDGKGAAPHMLEVTKLDHFPFVVPRWSKLPAEDYGRGPAWTALADLEMVQAMEMTYLELQQKVASPPLMTTDDGVVFPIQTYANGIIVGGLDPVTLRPRIAPLLPGGSVQGAEAFIERKKEAIKRAFLNNALTNQDRPQMTAEEVSTVRDENFRLLSPVITRLIDELLYPLLDLTYKMCKKHGVFTPVPNSGKDLDKQDILFVFDSPLANTSKLQNYMSLQRLIGQVIMPMAQLDPTIVDNLNMDNVINSSSAWLSIPSDIFKTPQQIQQLRQSRSQQQQQSQQLQQNLAVHQAQTQRLAATSPLMAQQVQQNQTGNSNGQL